MGIKARTGGCIGVRLSKTTAGFFWYKTKNERKDYNGLMEPVINPSVSAPSFAVSGVA